MRKLISIASASLLALALSAGAVTAAGPPGIGFYVDDALYRTVGTPTDFSNTGAPAHSFDTIYALGGDLLNVAESKPGDRDYNGGRWMVLPVTWHVTPVQLTSAEQVQAYADAGMLDIASEPVKLFECPVIPLRGNQR
ncbi:MAG: hypothetical protein M3253_02945 [Chloroflexota bacterium]|nr:hypothetical protein [Chloroflexota bacterium]